MEKPRINRMSPEEKERFGTIEGRPDLFETKLLRIKGKEGAKQSILIGVRDPGSGGALLPVMKYLLEHESVGIDVITDGRAQDLIQKNFQTEDMAPEGNILTAYEHIPAPQVILLDRSSSEMGIDSYSVANFPGVPKILVEDYYGTAGPFLLEMSKRNLSLPEKVCVMDEYAKQILLEKFPEAKNLVEVTGQPAFDKFANENIGQITIETKRSLGLREGDRLVSFMSTINKVEQMLEFAHSLQSLSDSFYFAFRKHPRDNTSYDTYKKIFVDHNVRVLDTGHLSTDQVGAASDVVITTWSTEGLYGVYRRKPTIHYVDPSFGIPQNLDLPLPPVYLGASVGIHKAEQFEKILPQLLNPESSLNRNLRNNMEKYYRVDGKNTERVASVVRNYLV